MAPIVAEAVVSKIGEAAMLTLYYAPGACSLVSHIALEEAAAAYKACPILTSKGEQLSEAYLKINPHGRVPALDTERGVLTENVAILPYVAQLNPSAGLFPSNPFAQSQALSYLGFFASSVHIAFSHYGRPERYISDESAFPQIRQAGLDSFLEYCKELDRTLSGRQWLMTDFTVCDGYPFVFYRWGKRANLPMEQLAGMTRHYADMLKRPAVKRALDQEGLQP